MNDMQHVQGLENNQDLPLSASPTHGKDFIDSTGYVSQVGPCSP